MRTYKNNGGPTDLRTMLLGAGIGQYNAIMSIPYMNFLPSTTDPYAQGVIQLVQGLQRLLIKRGARLVVDGGMGVETVRALLPWAGPRWYDKSWSQLYGDVMNGQPWDGWKRFNRGTTPWGRSAAMHDLGAESMTMDPSYCSDDNQPTGCTAVSGVVKAMTPVTLDVYINIQRTVNALLAKRSEPLIDVDGRIGPQTLAAMLTLSSDPAQLQSVETVAQNAAALLSALQIQAASESAPFVPDPSPKSPPSIVVGGSVVHPSDAAIAAAAGTGGLMATLFSPLGLVAMAVGGMLIYKSSKPKRRRR